MNVEQAAMVVHELNRAFCRAIGDTSQLSWSDAPSWQKESAVHGVLFHLENPQAGDECSHNEWMKEKVATGWVYGPVKNPYSHHPTHPCLVPFEELPLDQQLKNKLFRQTVRALTPLIKNS